MEARRPIPYWSVAPQEPQFFDPQNPQSLFHLSRPHHLCGSSWRASLPSPLFPWPSSSLGKLLKLGPRLSHILL